MCPSEPSLWALHGGHQQVWPCLCRAAWPACFESIARTRAFQSQAASKAGASAGGNNLAPTRLRIAQNWVMLTEHSGHSLQPLTIISFFPLTSVPSKRGEAGLGTFLEECEGMGEEAVFPWTSLPTLNTPPPLCWPLQTLLSVLSSIPRTHTPQTPAQTKATLRPSWLRIGILYPGA